MVSPFIRITVSCNAVDNYSLFIKTSEEHRKAEYALQGLDMKIDRLQTAERLLFEAVYAALEDGATRNEICILFEDMDSSALYEWLESDSISCDAADATRNEVHRARMALYPIKEELKKKRKKAYHAMKRLSFLTPNKTESKDFERAHQYYLTLH